MRMGLALIRLIVLTSPISLPFQDLSDSELEDMGKRSYELATERFYSDKIVREFVGQIIAFSG